MFYGAAFTAAIAVANGKEFEFEWTLPYIGSLLYLTIFGSIIAFGAYLTLLGRIGAHKAGYAMVMFPVIALVHSALFEGLEIDAPIIVGTLLVLAGNLFVINARAPAVKIDSDLNQGASTALAVRMSASNMSGCRNDGL